eukprot:496641_1
MGLLPFTAEELWPLCNLILPSYLLIAWNAKSKITQNVNTLTAIIYGCIYASIILPAMLYPPPDAPKVDFFTLKGVVNLFKNSDEEGIFAAWIHYVIIDFWTAKWIANDYQDNVKFSYGTKAFEICSLFLTMMFCPIGLMTYVFGKYVFLPPSQRKRKST